MWVNCKCARRKGGVSQLQQLAVRIAEVIVESELKHTEHRGNRFNSARRLLLAQVHEGAGKLLSHVLPTKGKEEPLSTGQTPATLIIVFSCSHLMSR